MVGTFFYRFDGGGEYQAATVGHRVARVRGQVDQHGFQLASVGQQRRQAGRYLNVQRYHGSQSRPENLPHGLEQRSGLHSFSLQLAAARKRQQTSSD